MTLRAVWCRAGFRFGLVGPISHPPTLASARTLQKPRLTSLSPALSPPPETPIAAVGDGSHRSRLPWRRLFRGGGFAGRRLGVSAMSTGSSAGSCLAEFPLSASCSLKIQKGDITMWSVDGVYDAIVNPANERMLGGGGADGAIHRAAGPELKEACYKVPEVRPGVRCPTGEARITPGFMLPAAYVIHTVGPIYDVDSNPEASLRSAYRNSLSVAKENKLQYIAFPAISCGVFRYPLEEAAKVAISTVKEFGSDLKEVHFVLFSDDIYNVWCNKAKLLVGG